MPSRIKGSPIRVIGGKYAGRNGWKHIGKGETHSQIYLILQAVVKDGIEVLPEKVIRIDKKNYQPFVRASNPMEILLEQKPRVQQKVNELVKELIKLQVSPNEQMLVTIGQQWVIMWQKKQAMSSVDTSRVEDPPQVTDDEADGDAAVEDAALAE